MSAFTRSKRTDLFRRLINSRKLSTFQCTHRYNFSRRYSVWNQDYTYNDKNQLCWYIYHWDINQEPFYTRSFLRLKLLEHFVNRMFQNKFTTHFLTCFLARSFHFPYLLPFFLFPPFVPLSPPFFVLFLLRSPLLSPALVPSLQPSLLWTIPPALVPFIHPSIYLSPS